MKDGFEKITERIDLLQIPFAGIWTGSYLVRKSGNVLIDSGLNAESVDRWIVPALAQKGLEVSDLDLVLCTHTHGDHIGGHHRLKELGAKRFGVFFLGLDKLRNPLKYNKLIRSVFPEESAPPAKKLDGVEADLQLCDGESIGGLQVIHTPGHDSDCVCFFDPESGLLLTGDSLQGNGTDTQGCALYMDLPGYRKSLEKIRRLPLRGIVPGHPFHPFGEETVKNPNVVEICLELLEKYDRLLENMPEKTLARRSRRLIELLGGRVPDKLFLAMYTVREHLKGLGFHEFQ